MGRPFVVLGITTTPPGPVYLMMVIVPLFVINENWPRAIVVSDNMIQIAKRAFPEVIMLFTLSGFMQFTLSG
jgi:hypothetical protein